MKLRSRWLIHLLAFLTAVFGRLWMNTLRVRVYDPDNILPPPLTRERRYIYAFWHEYMVLLLSRFGQGNIHVLISQHADGQFIAEVARHLMFGTVRGSPKTGVEAARGLLRAAQRGHLAITPDGPRGPRRKVQLGIIWAASQTGLPIICGGLAGGGGMRMRSWDRFFLPYPNSAATLVVGRAIHVPPNLSRAELLAYRQRVEDEMNRATWVAEYWLAHHELPVDEELPAVPEALRAA
jgi:lysophospholipid acyltransferase (LPLAT)-like uncharacterized protein